MKSKIEKKAKKLMNKRVKEERDKHPFFGLNQIPHNYASSQYPSSQFQLVHLGKPPFFDGTDYPKWAYEMKMHLYGLNQIPHNYASSQYPSSQFQLVHLGKPPPKNDVPTVEEAQDYFRNAQAMRVITSSLSAQEFNKVCNVEVAKKIWDTLRKAHEGTDEVRQGKMDLLQGELEHFVMHDEETMRQMYDRLMILVSDIRSLGSMEWDEHKVTKKMLRAFTPRNPTLATMIRRDPKFNIKAPNQLLDEILHQELVERDVAKSLSHKTAKSVALNSSTSDKVESSPKALKSKKEESREEATTDEEIALVLRNFKKFMKKKYYKKGGDDKKRPTQRRCYGCKEVGYYIADCPQLKNKEKDEKRYKEKSKDFKKKYQGHAHVGQEWESSHEDSNKECMANLTIPKSSRKLFNNISEDEDDAPFCLMARGTKVQESSTSSSHPSTMSIIAHNDFDDEEEQHKTYMIKEFGKKGFKEIKKLMEKLEKK
jgi:hypothetical protein